MGTVMNIIKKLCKRCVMSKKSLNRTKGTAGDTSIDAISRLKKIRDSLQALSAYMALKGLDQESKQLDTIIRRLDLILRDTDGGTLL
jgi:hypothetical protein